eukprot:590531-Hanusia_phi.AAC.1
MNNRSLIEVGILRGTKEQSLSQGIEEFVNEFSLEDRKSVKALSEHSRKVCKQLEQYDLSCNETSVSKELATLMHQISKGLH